MSAQAFPTHTLYIQNHELYKTHLGSCICKSHTTIWHKKSLWPRITTLQLYWSIIELMSTTQIRWDNSIFQLTGTSLKLIYFFKTCPFLQQYEGLSQPENKKATWNWGQNIQQGEGNNWWESVYQILQWFKDSLKVITAISDSLNTAVVLNIRRWRIACEQ